MKKKPPKRAVTLTPLEKRLFNLYTSVSLMNGVPVSQHVQPVYLTVGVQSFGVSGQMENKAHIKWTREALAKTLARLVEAEIETELASGKPDRRWQYGVVLPPIKNKTEHKNMLAAAEKLMAADPLPTSVQGRLLMMAAQRIEEYEKKYFPLGKAKKK